MNNYTLCATLINLIGPIWYSTYNQLEKLANMLSTSCNYDLILVHLDIPKLANIKTLTAHLFQHSVEIIPENLYQHGTINKVILGNMIKSNMWTNYADTTCTICQSKVTDIVQHVMKYHLEELIIPPTIQNEGKMCNCCLQPLHGLTEAILHQYYYHKNTFKNCPVCTKIIMPEKSYRHIMTCPGQFSCFQCKSSFRYGCLLIDHMAKAHPKPDVSKWCDINLMNRMYTSFNKAGGYKIVHKNNDVIDGLSTNDLMCTVHATKILIADKLFIKQKLHQIKETTSLWGIQQQARSKFLLLRNLPKTIQIMMSTELTPCSYFLKPEEFNCVIFESTFLKYTNFSMFKIVKETPALLGIHHLPKSVVDKFKITTNAFDRIIQSPPLQH